MRYVVSYFLYFTIVSFAWASGSSRDPQCLVDVVELGLKINVSFIHIKRSANEVADALPQEGVGRSEFVFQNFAS